MPALTPAVLVLTTFPADGDADQFAATLVEERLAACVNLLPVMHSIYRWEGKVEKAQERQIVIKTSARRLRELKKRLKTLHPYQVPELLIVKTDGGDPAYVKWVAESTRP